MTGYAAGISAQLDEPQKRAPYGCVGIVVGTPGASFTVAFRQFQVLKGDASIWRAVHTSKDPTSFAVLLPAVRRDEALAHGHHLTLPFTAIFVRWPATAA